MVLNIGPQHPSTHGVLRLKVMTDGEIVSDIEPIIGYLHRCFEKHCENSTYEQVIPFTDRCDYIASMNNNFGYVVAMEKFIRVYPLSKNLDYVYYLLGNNYSGVILKGYYNCGLMLDPYVNSVKN